MIRPTFSILVSTALSSLSALAGAHAGHDHGHWSSPAVHAVLLAAFVGIGVSAAFCFSRNLRNKKDRAAKKQAHR